MKWEYRLASLGVLAWASLAVPAVAAAQPAPAPEASESGQLGDIIVTARRRNETAIETPVVLSAFSGEQLARMGATTLTDVAKLTPQLVIAPTTGPYGGNLTLRGVASPSGNAPAEPAVTINIDGIPLSYGGVVRMATFDVGQVEILKGPQALFFGKNASGGIISLRSAEPTDTFKAQLSGGYEFKARQRDLEGFISGPIAEGLTGRIAGRFSRQRGYVRNVAPVRAFNYGPGTAEEALRVSLNWEPTDSLTVKLRGTYSHVQENGSYSTSQKFSCPAGLARNFGAFPAEADDCRANDTIVVAPYPFLEAQALTGDPAFNSAKNYLKVWQYLVSSDISYKLTDNLTLSSLTGYYRLRQEVLDSQTTGARNWIGGYAHVGKNVFSEELRLAYSNPDSPVDFMLGAFYQSEKFFLAEAQTINTAGGLVRLGIPWNFPLDSRSYSVFGQVGWDFASQLNLSAGLRYSRDDKRQDTAPIGGLPNKFGVRKRVFTNLSPEVTLAYRPHEDLNVFTSFKMGYKSGSYMIGAPAFTVATLTSPAVAVINNSYDPETVRGVEVGLKTRLFDRQLRLNLAGYYYQYKNLQVSKLDPVTIINQVLNASSARVRGLEADFSYTPRAVPGLTINGAASFNLARYSSSFFAACYVGQTIERGCILDGPDAGIVPDQQQFKGRPLPRAPKFSASLGFLYETPISESLKASINLNGIYTAQSFTTQELAPHGITPRRLLVDGNITIGAQSGAFDVSFIGRNLTNRYYPSSSGFQSPGTGGGTGTAVGSLADYEGPISRGRELWVKLTVRPSSF